MMRVSSSSRLLRSAFWIACCFVWLCRADDQGDDYYNGNDDGAVADEAGYYDNGYNGGDYNPYYTEGKDYIQYWTEYAIQPKRCVVYNNVDVIIFSLFENQYNQCSDTPMGTYYVPVQYYLQGTIQQKMQDMEDQGYEYEQPEVMQYAYCTGMEYQGQYYYLQVGCADDPTQGLAINIYEDKACTVRSSVEGYGDDANIDVSDIQIKLKKCRACVMWFDRDDDGNVDDGFYENRKQNAPLCSTTWTYKEECNKKCQRTGLERSRDSWSASDQILLAILTTFGLIMLGLIINKRQKMTNKETLLEQAAMSAAGLQQPHVIGIFVLVVLVIAVFALLGLKNITWFLLLLINTVLFAYLMKLTVSTVGGETLIGPDGQIIRQDSDDSSAASQEENHNNGTYVLPTIT